MFRRTLFGDLPLERWWSITNAERNHVWLIESVRILLAFTVASQSAN